MRYIPADRRSDPGLRPKTTPVARAGARWSIPYASDGEREVRERRRDTQDINGGRFRLIGHPSFCSPHLFHRRRPQCRYHFVAAWQERRDRGDSETRLSQFVGIHTAHQAPTAGCERPLACSCRRPSTRSLDARAARSYLEVLRSDSERSTAASPQRMARRPQQHLLRREDTTRVASTRRPTTAIKPQSHVPVPGPCSCSSG
ncbi:hypothetical protein C8R45DRAFT_541708 [Mycena sanguinolenta]|nr:hypothetical protein C8R45DRAFT_541708 [Mycena sanguinolenta]